MADAISRQAFSDSIGSIYDCALDPSRWERTLRDVMNSLDCHGLALGLTDLRHDRVLLDKTVDIDIELLSKHLAKIHAIAGRALASLPSLDDPWVVSRHLSPAYIEISPYFQELKLGGAVDNMTLILMHEPMHLSLFGVGRNERQGIITEREIELGKLLLPHVRRAVTISNVLDIRTIEGTRMAEALDALRCAVVLTNEYGTILHANRAAEHMLDEGGPLQSAKGILQATSPSAALSCAPSSPLRPRTRPALTKPGWRSASPSPKRRPSSLTSCRSPGAISAPGCNPRPLRPCSSVRHRTRRRVQAPWQPPFV